MPYTIFSHDQITPDFVERPSPQGGTQYVPNPELPPYPEGSTILYKPEGYTKYSPLAENRKLLLFDPNGTATPEEILETFPQCLDRKYQYLWEKASAYEARYISGVGLSILAIGVSKQKPKALACSMWTQKLWTEYYKKKAGVTIEDHPDIDFSIIGDMPYTVMELSAEIM